MFVAGRNLLQQRGHALDVVRLGKKIDDSGGNGRADVGQDPQHRHGGILDSCHAAQPIGQHFGGGFPHMTDAEGKHQPRQQGLAAGCNRGEEVLCPQRRGRGFAGGGFGCEGKGQQGRGGVDVRFGSGLCLGFRVHVWGTRVGGGFHRHKIRQRQGIQVGGRGDAVAAD